MNKELEKRVKSRREYIFDIWKSGGTDWMDRLAKQTLIWELEARIEECDEHWTKGNVRLNQLQSELKMLKGE